MFETHFKSLMLKRKSLALGLFGDPGIGKSHTVKTLLANSSLPHLSLHATTPMTSLATALPVPQKLPSWAQQTLKHANNIESKKLLEAISTSLAHLAPFILHLEDIHETRSEQLTSIQELAQHLLQTKGVGLLVTSRTQPPEPFESQRLMALSKEASDTLLQTTLKTQLPPETLGWIYDQALGNPLYSLEYLRFLARQGYLWNDGESWNWRKPETSLMPASIENLIELHLSKIHEPHLEKAQQVKAYLPPTAKDSLWAQMLNVSLQDLTLIKHELQEKIILKEDQFIHPLYREVILKNLPKLLRQELAQKALLVFQDDPVQAASFIGDANFPSAKSLDYLKAASETAKHKQQKALAGKLLAQAVSYAQGQQRGQLALEAARLLDGVDYPAMREYIEIACQTLAEPLEALYLKMSALSIQGKYQEMQEVIEALAPKDKQGQKWFEHYIRLLYETTKHHDLISFWEAQREFHHASSNTAHYVAWSYVHLGNFQKATELSNEWLNKTTLQQHDRWNLLQIRASIAFYQGHYLQAEQDYNECLSLDVSEEPEQDVANILRNRSVTRLQLGLYQESLPDLLKALTIYSNVGNRIHYAQTLVMTSYVYLELGDYERTEAVLLEALDIFKAVQPQPFLSHALVQISHLYLQMPNRIYLAKKYASEALSISETVSDKSCLIIAIHAMALVELQLGNLDKALTLVDQALEAANQTGIYEAQLSCHHARGLVFMTLGQTQAARDAFTFAHEGAKQHNMLLEEHKFALELDHLDHNLSSARQHLNWFKERKLFNGVNLVEQYFPELKENAEVVPTTLKVRLNVLGSMQFCSGNHVESIQGRKRQEFLAILLEARMTGRHEVSRLEFFDNLYPDKNEQQASSSLKELVSALRDRLGNSLILTTQGGYALGHISSDAEQFLKTLDTTLWRGPYLQDLSLETQKSVAESLFLTLHNKAQELQEQNPKESARVAKLLLEHDPYNLDYLALCLQALRNSNNHKSLNRLYTEAKQRFSELGESLPEQWQSFLA